MARFYAQVCMLVFLIVGVGGLFLGNANAVTTGEAGGNLGGITLQMTWARDAVDLLMFVLFAYVGLFASRSGGRLLVLAAGIFLLMLAALGLVVGDNAQASTGVAGLHFPVVVNIFDTVFGVLAVLAGLGTLGDAEVGQSRSVLRTP